MTKREQIILALMAVTLVVGGYMYFSDSANQKATVPLFSMAEVKALQADVNTAMSTQGLSESQKYILEIIGDQWQNDPFVIIDAKGSETVVEKVVDTVEVTFDYSAYVIIGDAFVGVINGREYQVGDSLAQDGYTLVRIDTKSALIKGPGVTNMIVVPYREYVVDN
jgi:hypothetical protein